VTVLQKVVKREDYHNISMHHKDRGVGPNLTWDAYRTEKIENSIGPLHMGTWVGLPDKVTTFL
jgi:hypothetical protein